MFSFHVMENKYHSGHYNNVYLYGKQLANLIALQTFFFYLVFTVTQ